MLADQMADSAPLLLWNIMSVWARRASRTVAFDEVLTDRLRDFGGRPERGQRLFEEGVKVECWWWRSLRLKDLVRGRERDSLRRHGVS